MAETRKALESTTTKRQPRRNGYTKFLVGGAVFAAAVAYMIFSAVQGSGVYYLTITELKQGEAGSGPVRVAGAVVDGTVQYDPRTMNATFTIADGPETVAVAFKGVLPDAFKSDVDVIVEGRYTSGQPFQATEILTKCPSKYENAVAEPEQKQ